MGQASELIPDKLSVYTDAMSNINTAAVRRRKLLQGEPAPRKSERTRKAILDAALEFLWSHPFRDLTVGGLMSSVGASRPTFYQYFTDLHELMETLLKDVGGEILAVSMPWLEGDGDPVPLLMENLSGLVKVTYQRGPILRAVAEAAASDARLEQDWNDFVQGFDTIVAAKIEQQQAAGLIAEFPALPVAMALNRLDAALVIDQFGRRPRGKPKAVEESLTRVWVSTLYGPQTLN